MLSGFCPGIEKSKSGSPVSVHSHCTDAGDFLYTEAYNIWENRDKTPGLSFWASRKWIVFRNCGPVYIVSMDNFGYNKKDLR